MKETLKSYIAQRSNTLGKSILEICALAGISRQTYYNFGDTCLPEMKTIVALASALEIHPLRLLNIIFEPISPTHMASDASTSKDMSGFARDVSFADGALVQPNQVFVKTWEVHNLGQTHWENRYLQCLDEEIVVYTRLGEQLLIAAPLHPTTQRIPIPYTRVGETVRLSVEFTAPALPCSVLSYWKSTFEDGTLCFPDAHGLWCHVRVCELTSCTIRDSETK